MPGKKKKVLSWAQRRAAAGVERKYKEPQPLTARQMQIARMAVDGAAIKEIAAVLKIKEQTVKERLKAAREKRLVNTMQGLCVDLDGKLPEGCGFEDFTERETAVARSCFTDRTIEENATDLRVSPNTVKEFRKLIRTKLEQRGFLDPGSNILAADKGIKAHRCS